MLTAFVNYWINSLHWFHLELVEIGTQKANNKNKKNPTSCTEELPDLEFLHFLLFSFLWTFPPPISNLADEYVHNSYKVGKTKC